MATPPETAPSLPPRCPCCGVLLPPPDLAAGIYGYSAATGFTVRGQPLAKRRQLGVLLGTILAAAGEIVDDQTLATAIGSSAADLSGLIAVRMTSLRRELKRIDGGWPVSRKYGGGWFWSGPALGEQAAAAPRKGASSPRPIDKPMMAGRNDNSIADRPPLANLRRRSA